MRQRTNVGLNVSVRSMVVKKTVLEQLRCRLSQAREAGSLQRSGPMFCDGVSNSETTLQADTDLTGCGQAPFARLAANVANRLASTPGRFDDIPGLVIRAPG